MILLGLQLRLIYFVLLTYTLRSHTTTTSQSISSVPADPLRRVTQHLPIDYAVLRSVYGSATQCYAASTDRLRSATWRQLIDYAAATRHLRRYYAAAMRPLLLTTQRLRGATSFVRSGHTALRINCAVVTRRLRIYYAAVTRHVSDHVNVYAVCAWILIMNS